MITGHVFAVLDNCITITPRMHELQLNVNIIDLIDNEKYVIRKF